MISTNELSFPMPAANLIAQRDPMRFVDTALYADDCAAESVTLVRADFLAADACGRFPAVALIEIMAQTIGIYAGRLQRLAGEPPVVGLLLGTRRMSLPIAFFTPGDKLFCRVQKKFESDEGLWQFDCEVMLIERASGAPAASLRGRQRSMSSIRLPDISSASKTVLARMPASVFENTPIRK